jgi:energy-coupling factor transport system ATP-binding protein
MPIVVERVSHIYMEGTPMAKVALRDVSLTIEDGEFVGLIGHTGSGKSTLVQHFNGLLMPTSGRVYVDGVDLTDKHTSLRAIRQKVGMVFQYPEHQVFGETVFEDVAFGPRNAGLEEREVEARVKEALEMVGLDYSALKDHSPFELSGGQKRRVAIAGVLAMKPAVLILDEPTAGLDPEGSADILSKIQALHGAGKVTVIMVTHSMEDVARMSTRLVVMEQGGIVFDGAPREVFTQVELLKEMGLGVPQVTELMHELKGKGLPVQTNILTLEEAEAELVRVLELKRHGTV